MNEEFALPPPSTGMDGGSFVGTYLIVILLAMGFLFALLQYKAAHRTGNADIAWWAFIPIMNTLLLIQMAEKPMSWIIWLIIPGVNIFAFFALWMQAARNAGVSAFWGFLVPLFPLSLVGLFVMATATRPYTYPDFMETAGPSRPQGPKGPGGPPRPRSPQSVG